MELFEKENNYWFLQIRNNWSKLGK